MDDSIATFTDQARRYCALVEDETVRNSWIFAQECLRAVLRLYDGALLLPSIEPTTEESLNRVAHLDWETVRKRVSKRLQRDYYWQIFEPLAVDPPEPVAGSLSDDLADIWRELKVGLLAMDDNTESANVVWHWRFSFESHWAQHAAGAIGALNALCYGQFADPNRP